MNPTSTTQLSASGTIVRLLFFWFMSISASFTFLTHVSQFVGLAFRTYAFICLGAVLIISGIAFIISRVQLRKVICKDILALAVVLIMGSVGAILALVSHRPDMDDFYYVPNAVYYLENRNEPMGFDIHFLDGADSNFTSYAWGTSLAYDYGRAVIAYSLRVEYLFVYYILSVALVGFLIPLALFYLTSHFSNNTMSAALGTIIAVGILPLLGETHRAFGNFAFNRAFQGKTLLLAVGIPVFAAATIDCFRTRSLYSWTLLFATSTSMVGATSSTIVLLPALLVALVISSIVISPDRKRAVLLAFACFASLWYVILYALTVMALSTADLGSNSPINKTFPTTFLGHALLIINERKPVSLIVLIGSTILSLLLMSGNKRRFLIAWIISVLALYLNPLAATLLIEYVTTPNAYWRMFYLYPFPLVVSVAAAALYARVDNAPKSMRIAILALMGITLIGLHFPSFSTSVFQYGTRISWPPSYKVSSSHLRCARNIIAVVPEGTMLAPPQLSGIVPMLSSGYPQVRIREDGVRLWWCNRGLCDEAEARINASRFVGGEKVHFPAFQRLLDQVSVRSIVLQKTVFEDPEVRELLKAHQFMHQQAMEGYVIVWR